MAKHLAGYEVHCTAPEAPVSRAEPPGGTTVCAIPVVPYHVAAIGTACQISFWGPCQHLASGCSACSV
jgi:hypothetical protein